MPQRTENNFFLWSLDNLTAPVHSFAGHTDVGREFVWRTGNPANQEFQLLSISKGDDFRMWKIEPQQLQVSFHILYTQNLK